MKVFFPGRGRFIRKVAPRQRRVPGAMNKAERRYAESVLEPLKRDGKIQDYKYEAITLRLAPRTTYTPDFMVIGKDFIEFHEFKGFRRDDAMVKFKTAAEMYPWFGWKMIQQKNQKSPFVVTLEF